MKTATALILESGDFTKDQNLKKEAFEAFAKAELVVHEGRVIKTGATMLPQAPQEPVRRVRRARVAEVPQPQPQAAPEPQQEPANQFSTSINDELS